MPLESHRTAQQAHHKRNEVLAVAALIVAAGTSGAWAQYSFRELSTNGFQFAQVRDVANGMAVGYGVANGNNQFEHAIAWPVNGGDRIDISHGIRTEAMGIDNQWRVAGNGFFTNLRRSDPAFWSSLNASPRDLSAELEWGQGNATQNGLMVGWGHRLSAPSVPDSAFVWNGATGSRTTLPFPSGALAATGRDLDGPWIVGDASIGAGNTFMGAVAWDVSNPSNARVIELHPDGFEYSTTNEVKAGRAVGLARQAGDTNHAYLWDLNSGAATDLQAMIPASWNVQGSSASDLRGNLVVGSAFDANGRLFALAWNLTNGTVTDLSQFLPSTATQSTAAAINDDGQIVGDWRIGADNNIYVLTPQRVTGDADGNGVINFDDYARIDFGFNNGVNGWGNGDFNYDGTVNFDDYSLIDHSFNTRGGPGTSPVPEPATAGALIGAVSAMLIRRRRSS